MLAGHKGPHGLVPPTRGVPRGNIQAGSRPGPDRVPVQLVQLPNECRQGCTGSGLANLSPSLNLGPTKTVPSVYLQAHTLHHSPVHSKHPASWWGQQPSPRKHTFTTQQTAFLPSLTSRPEGLGGAKRSPTVGPPRDTYLPGPRPLQSRGIGTRGDPSLSPWRPRASPAAPTLTSHAEVPEPPGTARAGVTRSGGGATQLCLDCRVVDTQRTRGLGWALVPSSDLSLPTPDPSPALLLLPCASASPPAPPEGRSAGFVGRPNGWG